MALAQVWVGDFPMPTQAEMDAEATAHYQKVVANSKVSEVAHTGLHTDLAYDQWLNAAAGTGFYERVGSWTSWKCWKLWWQDPKLYKLLIDGIFTAHVLRLFETDRVRQAWPGARAAIEKANADVQALEEREMAMKLKSKLKTK